MRFALHPRRKAGRRDKRTPALIAAVLVVGFVLSRFPQVAEWFEPPPPAPEMGRVAHVIDGDTVILADHRRVRLLGIDTPETRHSRRALTEGEDDPFAAEATETLRTLVEGKPVTLEFGPVRTDRYDRTLAYLRLADGTDVNAELLRRGLAVAYRGEEHPRAELYLAAEREARAEQVGLWSE